MTGGGWTGPRQEELQPALERWQEALLNDDEQKAAALDEFGWSTTAQTLRRRRKDYGVPGQTHYIALRQAKFNGFDSVEDYDSHMQEVRRWANKPPVAYGPSGPPAGDLSPGAYRHVLDSATSHLVVEPDLAAFKAHLAALAPPPSTSASSAPALGLGLASTSSSRPTASSSATDPHALAPPASTSDSTSIATTTTTTSGRSALGGDGM